MPRRRSATASAIAASSGEVGVSGVIDPGPLTPEEVEAPPRLHARGKGRGGSRPRVKVDRDILTDTCRVVLGSSSYLAGLAVAAPDMALAQELSMTGAEASAIAEPLANILSGTALVQKYARYINNGGDWVKLTAALADYSLRFTSTYLERRPIRGHSQPLPTASNEHRSNAAASNGHQPASESGVYAGSVAAYPAHLLAQ